MMKNNLLPIAKEGLNYIGYAVLAFIVTIFFVFVFRNPERELPRFEKHSVMAPVDGTVLAIEEISGKEYAYKVTIDSGYLDVAILRAPVSGSVVYIEKVSGARLKNDTLLSQKINENVNIVFEDSHSNILKVSHILKQSFDGIKINLSESKNVLQTSRYGIMVYGVTTIYLPQNFRLDISVGSELKAAETLVGYFT